MKSLYDLGLEVESLNNSIGSYEARLSNFFVPRREKREIRAKLPALREEFELKRSEYKQRIAAFQQAQKNAECV